MTPNIKISTYQGVTDRTGSETYVHIAIEEIRGSKVLEKSVGVIRDYVAAIESLEQKALDEPDNPQWPASAKDRKAEYDQLKKKLPAVTWSGAFTQRKADKIELYSGLMCIDIDKLPASKLELIKERLRLDQYTFLVFTSPSGNGLKVVIKVGGDTEDHTPNFLALEKYFYNEYNISIDQSGKDCSRLCFLSFDPYIFHNSGSTVFSHRSYHPVQPTVYPALTKKEERSFIDAPANDLDWIKNFTDKKLPYAEGSRNKYVHQFACNCNRKGVDINDCLTYVTGFAHDLDIKEVSATIKSAYENNAHEANKFAKRQAPPRQVAQPAAKAGFGGSKPPVPPTAATTTGKNEEEERYIKFWWFTEDEKRLDENNEPLKKYNLIYNKLIEFCEDAGFYRLRLANNTYQYIRFKDNVSEPVGIINMKDYIFNWLRTRQYTGVLEMMRRGANRYFTMQNMEGVLYKEIEFGRDTQHEAFFYFKNCIACVTKDGVKTMPYTTSQKAIWKSSMIQRDFTPVDLKLPINEEQGPGDPNVFKKCEMAKYILLVSHSPKSKEDITDHEGGLRFLSVCSSIGYMLHGFKSRVAKAVIAVDHKIPEDRSEQNGGTGKSIVGESFKYLKSTTVIDGREFKEDYPFRFEMVGVDTKIVVMQDCRYNLDFGSFFVPITNDFVYNRRHTGYITLPFADSPKWWFDTNFVFKGEGASFRRRMHVIEFDDFFDENHTPYDEFGHFLFQDWDDAQWNQFFNFYLYCVQLYLNCGLIDYPKSNYENRKMVSESPSEFIDFLDATNDDLVYKIKRNDWFEKKELLKLWNEEAKSLSMQATTPHLLTKWMKKYTQARPFKLHKDKTNGIEWWLIADTTYKGTGKRSEKPNTPTAELF